MDMQNIKYYWPMVVALAIVAVGWGAGGARLANAEKDIISQEDRIKAIESDLGDVKTSTSLIENNQRHMKEDIGEIKESLGAIAESLEK